MKYIEDICFFEVNTKYISSSELKTSEFSRVRRVFNSREKKSKFSFYFIQGHFPIHKAGGEKAKNFGTTLLLTL